MITFAVSDVEPVITPLDPLDRDAALRSLLHTPVEQLCPATRPLVLCTDEHPFAAAAHEAFYQHRPLILSPDAVWFCLAQGFAHHVSLNAERLRERFVRFSGKQKLRVRRPDFRLGRKNPWPEVFANFAQQIAGHVGKLRDLVTADFSTTGPTERAAFDVVVMDVFQAYFEYEMAAGCGIPAITLLGTVDDWRSVRRRAAMLGELELSHWIDALLPVLDQIIATAEGKPNRAFWQSFFRYESSSGGHEMTGWIQLLFPYLSRTVPREREPVLDTKPPPSYDADSIRILSSKEAAERRQRLYTKVLVPNPHMLEWESGLRNAEARAQKGEWVSWSNLKGPSLGEIPSGLAGAPVLLTDERDNSEHKLRFVGGLFGVAQDAASGALQPEFGWAIVYDLSKN